MPLPESKCAISCVARLSVATTSVLWFVLFFLAHSYGSGLPEELVVVHGDMSTRVPENVERCLGVFVTVWFHRVTVTPA
jgi:hypothetical protein